MKPTEYTRKGQTITQLDGDTKKRYYSLTQAKKESWRIQMRLDGALGRGSLKVVK